MEMQNRFNVTECRMKYESTEEVLIYGWFQRGDAIAAKLTFCYAGKEVPYTLEVFQDIGICQKYYAQGRDVEKEYRYTLHISRLTEAEPLKIMAEEDGEKQVIFHISGKEILKTRLNMRIIVDESILIKGNVYIRGWYLSKEPVKVEVTTVKGIQIPFKERVVPREDVEKGYFEVDKTYIKGFELECEKNDTDTFLLKAKAGKIKKKIVCKLKGETKEKHILKKLIEKADTSVRRVNYYLKENGWKGSIKKGYSSLFYASEDYHNFRHCFEPMRSDISLQKERKFQYTPKFSFLVEVSQIKQRHIKKGIESILAQTYENWELCIFIQQDLPYLRKQIQAYAVQDKRIRIIEDTYSINGEYLVFLSEMDILTPYALYECTEAVNRNREYEMLYADEDHVTMNGKIYFQPHFKSDFNIDLLCSTNYISNFLILSKTLYERTGALKKEQEYDFVLRCAEKAKAVCHIPKVLSHRRTNRRIEAKQVSKNDLAAVQAHYDRIGVKAKVSADAKHNTIKTEYLLETEPLVSIIIPNKDHIQDLKKCIQSLDEKSTYHNYEYVIVENNSELEETFAYYEQLKKENPKVKIVTWEREFNYSLINNYGVQYAKGEYLLFLNNDIEFISPDCIREMLGQCMREDVGIVGAKLYYPDKTIQHGGVVIGIGGAAGHIFTGLGEEDEGYFSRAVCAQNLSAVTAACMLVKRKAYEEVGGFEEEFQVAFNDIDFCLKVREKGYLVVYNPYASLFHYESKSRGLEDTQEKMERFHGEVSKFISKWEVVLEKGDPYYNPNLSLIDGNFNLKFKKR